MKAIGVTAAFLLAGILIGCSSNPVTLSADNKYSIASDNSNSAQNHQLLGFYEFIIDGESA
ncbi:MAG TPA: hypothetical protein VGB30_05410 [bacterium]|jgi:hypothetical protein